MDAQELRNLQEAYMEIYHNELDEGKVEWDNPKRHLPSGLTPREKNRAKRISTGVENPNIKPSEKQLERYGKLKIAHDTEKGKKVPRNKRHRFSQFDTGPFVSDPELKRREKKNKLKDLKEPKESYDYYDIILSHLLDEGYAETPEAAEAIMVNMSEEWRESICEELTGERRKRALEKGTPLANRVARAKEGQPRERTGPPYLGATKKAPIKRGGIGDKGRGKSEWTGYESDRGSGNKAARRAGKKVRDTSDEL